MPAAKERRQYLRHPIRVPIKVQMGKKDITLKSQTGDLSQGGLQFLTAEQIPQGTLIDVTIPMGDRLFRLYGWVVWVSSDSKSGLFKTGVSFDQPVMSFRAKLAEEVHRIREFRDETERKTGRPISEEEAASIWIDKYAQKFAELYQP